MSFTALLLAVVFSADTSNPTNSFFRRGEAATVTFAVSGIPSGGESTALTPGTISAGNHENLAKFMPPEGRAFCASNGIRSVNLWNYLKSPGGWTVRYRMAIPWAFMNRSAAPAAGESARFALWVCDRDAGDKGARHGVKLFDFRRASAPKRYGRVIMGEK